MKLTPEEQEAFTLARGLKNLAVVVALAGGFCFAVAVSYAALHSVHSILWMALFATGLFGSHWLIKLHDRAIVDFTLIVARETFKRNMDAIQTYDLGLHRAANEAGEKMKEHVDEQ